MTNPTQLSPAAQAVLNALNETSWDWASMEQASPQTIAAAALRAAADNCIDRMWSVEMDDLYRELYAIADELEAQ